MRDKMEAKKWENGQLEEEGKVKAIFGCPGCGEVRVELLIRAEDGVVVDCGTCGTVYDPMDYGFAELSVVDEEMGCPGCGERRTDELVWQDEETVKCSTCGKSYEPGDEPKVESGDECPKCGEDRLEFIECNGDGEVKCLTCNNKWSAI